MGMKFCMYNKAMKQHNSVSNSVISNCSTLGEHLARRRRGAEI